MKELKSYLLESNVDVQSDIKLINEKPGLIGWVVCPEDDIYYDGGYWFDGINLSLNSNILDINVNLDNVDTEDFDKNVAVLLAIFKSSSHIDKKESRELTKAISNVLASVNKINGGTFKCGDKTFNIAYIDSAITDIDDEDEISYVEDTNEAKINIKLQQVLIDKLA